MIKRLVCPVCKKPTFWSGNAHRPFCSERCRLIDLASWLGEAYAIPGEQTVQSTLDGKRPDGVGENDREKDRHFLPEVSSEPRGGGDAFP